MAAKELTFDLDELKELRDGTEEVCKKLINQRDSLKKGLEQLRKDWKTPCGNYFFSQLDDDWESDVAKFISTISMFKDILSDSIEKFKKVEDKADSIKFE